MKPVIKNIRALDIDNLETYQPKDPENFALYLELTICPDGSDCGEFWQLTVCTPKWLERYHDKSEIISGRHHLIVFEYHYRRLIERIHGHILNFCTGETWDEISEKISQFALWEFEGYKP
jgi:hypothetical protein